MFKMKYKGQEEDKFKKNHCYFLLADGGEDNSVTLTDVRNKDASKWYRDFDEIIKDWIPMEQITGEEY